LRKLNVNVKRSEKEQLKKHEREKKRNIAKIRIRSSERFKKDESF